MPWKSKRPIKRSAKRFFGKRNVVFWPFLSCRHHRHHRTRFSTSKQTSTACFFSTSYFFNSFFFPLKKQQKTFTNPPFFPFCWCLRLAEEEGGRGRGEPDAQLRSGSQQPRGEFEKVVKKMWRKKMYEKMLRCFLRKQIWQHIRKKQQNKKFEFQKLRYFTFHRRIRSYGS